MRGWFSSQSRHVSLQRSWKSREISIRNWAWRYPGTSKESCATWRPTWTRSAMVRFTHTHTHTLLAGMKQVTRELQYWSLVLLLSTFTQGHPWHLAISSPSTHALFCYAARPNYSAALLMRTNCAIVGANGFPDGYPGACQACSLNHWPNAQARLW